MFFKQSLFFGMFATEKGNISSSELFAYFEVESTPFEKYIFSLFDEGFSILSITIEYVLY